MENNDGGPAFPSVGKWESDVPEKGMTLRDYFAGQAIVIMLRSWDGMTDAQMVKHWGVSAYLVADSMLAAREVK